MFQKIEVKPASAFSAPEQSLLLQRRCCTGQNNEQDEKFLLNLQRRATNEVLLPEVHPIAHDVLRSSGEPLAQETRAFMEPRFGHDFSKVRVHSDEKAAESARSIDARAYTTGHHVVLAEPPEPRLLAHELTHVTQQEKALGMRDDNARTLLRKPGHGMRLASDSLDRNADEAADAVLAGRAPRIIAGSFDFGMQKKKVPEYRQHPCDDKEPTNAKIFNFIRAHAADAETIGKEAGVPTDWILAVAAEETEYGTSGIVTKSNNFFGLHVSNATDTKHFKKQTGVYKTTGKPPVFVAVFSSGSGFLDSGMGFASSQKDNISGIKDFHKFASVIHAHGYGTTNPNYVSELESAHDLIATRLACPKKK